MTPEAKFRGAVRVPLRLKFSLTVLVLVTAVLGTVTFSTVNLFQDDKRAYVNGLTSMVALSTAEEARTQLHGYRDKLGLYARLLAERAGSGQHEELARTVFDEFPELVAAVIRLGEDEPAVAYNAAAVEAAGLTLEDLDGLQAQLPASARLREQPLVRNAPLSSVEPLFTMAFAQAVAAVEEPAVVFALLRSERLLALTSRFSAYDQSLVDSDGNFLAHSDAARVIALTVARLPPGVEAVHRDSSANVTTEFMDGGTEMIGGFASVDFGTVVAGAQIPSSAAYLASRRLVARLLGVTAALLVLAIVVGAVWAHRITRPIERLSRATRTIAKGDFDLQVPVETRDEMSELAGSFNQMAAELKTRHDELETHAKLVHSEKMAAFGQLGAGIAHEVKNPLAGILACAQLCADDVPAESRLYHDLKLIEKESLRCKSIIENLLKFARQERSEKAPTDLNDVIRDSTAIVNHQLELHQVRIETELGPDLPPVLGNANQLQQVFMNLLINAHQAMEGIPGTVRVSSCVNPAGEVQVRFADTGPGIPEEIREKIFEPFFTTKPAGKGTGLGLSVSYGIIKDHNGGIHVESRLGAGTTFVIDLPTLAGRTASA